MALTAQKLALRLAKYIGVTNFDPTDSSNAAPLHHAGLREGDLDELVACINGALQEMWELAPKALSFSQLSLQLQAPLNVALRAATGSEVVTEFTSYAAWMAGCAIRLNGDARVNEIVDGGRLLRPYQGTGGRVGGVVYLNCATLAAEVISVIGSVKVAGVSDEATALRQASSRAEFERWVLSNEYEAGFPQGCLIETRYYPKDGLTKNQVRLFPLPDEALVLTVGVRLNAPVVRVEDLGATSDPKRTFPIPNGWDEAVLLPLALRRFSAHPNFEANQARVEIERQATVARRLLSAVNPSREMARMVPTFR